MLKMAGVKSEKDFYKKFPTEEAFMAKYGKKFEKAKMGKAMVQEQLEQLTDFGNPPEAAVGQMLNSPTQAQAYKPVSLSDIQSGVNANQAGLTKDQYLKNQQAAQQAPSSQPQQGQTGPQALIGLAGEAMKHFGGNNANISKLGDTIGQFAKLGKNGTEIPQAFGGDILGGLTKFTGGVDKLLGKVNLGGGAGVGSIPGADKLLGNVNLSGITGGMGAATATGAGKVAGGAANDILGKNVVNTPDLGQGMFGKLAGGLNKGLDKLGGAGNVISSGMDIMKGFGQMKEQKNAYNKADQSMQLSGLGLQAASGPKQIEHRDYMRPEDQRFAQNQMSPSYGTGSNVLSAADGAELKGYSNTYNDPYTLYSGLGYEPLNDSSIKQYEDGGYISHNWNPQVITHFGDMTKEDFDKAAHEMRWGGQINENKMYGTDYYPIAADGEILDSAIRAKTDLQTTTTDGRYTQNLRDAISSTDRYADGRPVEKTDMYTMTKGDQDNQRVKQFLRSQVGDEAPQYSMQKTYKPLFSDQYKTKSRTIGEGRGERRMADMEQFLSEPQTNMANGGAMNGKLQTHWGGKAEDISYNKYGAGTGLTSMLSGNKHSQSDGHGNTGIGVGYAEDGQELQNIDVQAEAQDNEPMLEVEGPNGKPVAHVAGKIKIPKYVAKHLGDESAEGKTFQKYIADLATRENKANKKITEGLKLINGSNPDNVFENPTFMSGKFKKDGGEDILESVAQLKEKAMHWQSAFNEAAPEFGYDDSAKFVEDANKGKINFNKSIFGSKLETAADGTELSSYEYDGEKEPWNSAPYPSPYRLPAGSTLFDGSKRYPNSTLRDNDGSIVQHAPLFGRMLGVQDKHSYFNPLLDSTLMSGDTGYRPGEFNPETNDRLMYNQRTSQFNPDYNSAFTFGTQLPFTAAPPPIADPATLPTLQPNGQMAPAQQAPAPTQAQVKAVAKQMGVSPAVAAAAISQNNQAGASATNAPAGGTANPATATAPGLPEISKADYDEISSLYEAAKKAGKGPAVLKFQQAYNKKFPEYAKSVIAQYPGSKIKSLKGNEDSIFGKRTQQYMTALGQPKAEGPKFPGRTVTAAPPISPVASKFSTTPIKNKIKFPWEPLADQAMDYLNKPLRKDLDSNQLAGEMYALANNQLEPIRAQKVSAALMSPYQISLQDQLNANQADFNSLVKQAGNNPAALSTLAAQKYRANSGVSGEEFRINQGLAANAYDKNRAELRDTAFKNMDIMNNQWMLQEKAKANTKSTNIAALSSIADKYAKNASENFAGAIAQNMYPKFNFNAAGKAYVNPSFTNPINMPTLGTGEDTANNIPSKISSFADYFKGGTPKATKATKSTMGANGLIVKNFKRI